MRHPDMGMHAATVHVPVRDGAQALTLKRFSAACGHGGGIPQLQPAVLLVHGGPGRTSRCLEPLAVRLCAETGRTCYLYDQLGCGMPNRHLLQHGAADLRDVARFLSEQLGEPEVHLLGHNFGGVLIMEALLRLGMWGSMESGAAAVPLPKLCSVCLLSTPSSTARLKTESWRLMRSAKAAAGPEHAAAFFWYKHYCGLQSPECLAEAYAGDSETPLGGWEPWDTWVLRGWEIRRAELAQRYAQATGGAPLLSVRGADDFVTAACVEAWRGAGESLAAAIAHGGGGGAAGRSGGGFLEAVLSGCGHNSHLEDPGALSALLCPWLANVETPAEGGA